MTIVMKHTRRITDTCNGVIGVVVIGEGHRDIKRGWFMNTSCGDGGFGEG